MVKEKSERCLLRLTTVYDMSKCQESANGYLYPLLSPSGPWPFTAEKSDHIARVRLAVGAQWLCTDEWSNATGPTTLGVPKSEGK